MNFELGAISDKNYLSLFYKCAHIDFELELPLKEITSFISENKSSSVLVYKKVSNYCGNDVSININANWMQFMIDSNQKISKKDISFGIWNNKNDIEDFVEMIKSIR